MIKKERTPIIIHFVIVELHSVIVELLRVRYEHLRQLFPRHPLGARPRVGLGGFDGGAVALGVAFDLEGLLRPEDHLAFTLPPSAGRALLVVQSGSLHGWFVLLY